MIGKHDKQNLRDCLDLSKQSVKKIPISGNTTIPKNEGGLSDLTKSNKTPQQKSSSQMSSVPLAHLVESHRFSKPVTRDATLTSNPNIGLSQISSLPLSALAGAYLSSSPAASDVTQGQGSLSQLAGSHSDATKEMQDRDVLSGQLVGLSLSDLSKCSLSSTPPRQFPIKQHNLQPSIDAGGVMSSQGVSLSSLAPSHPSTNPLKLEPSGKLGIGNKLETFSPPRMTSGQGLQGAVRPTAGSILLGAARPSVGSILQNPSAGSGLSMPGVSLSSLATFHLSTNLPVLQKMPPPMSRIRKHTCRDYPWRSRYFIV